jgi:N-acetylmuramoyl-L-alanine amidase
MRWNKGANRVCDLAFRISLVVIAALPSVGQPATTQTPASGATSPSPTERPLFILIDPAHGGSDTGARLTASTAEKEITLAVARRLRQELGVRGIECRLVRDSDVTLSADQRAGIANAAAPALYIALHVSSVGNGISVFTTLLPVAGENHGPFLDWDSAQSFSLSRSKALQHQLVAAIQKTGFPVRGSVAPLRPLNNVKSPVIAIEIAPATGDASQVAAPGYQQMICAAVANALAAMLPSLRTRAGEVP